MSLAVSTTRQSSQQPKRSKSDPPQEDDPTWGSNFWVTLVDPKVVYFSVLPMIYCSTPRLKDTDIFLCLPRNWSSQLGRPRRQFCVSGN